MVIPKRCRNVFLRMWKFDVSSVHRFPTLFFSHLFGVAILHTWDKRGRSRVVKGQRRVYFLVKSGGFTRKQVTHHALELLSDWITGGQRNDSNSGFLTHHHQVNHQLFLSSDQKNCSFLCSIFLGQMFLHFSTATLGCPIHLPADGIRLQRGPATLQIHRSSAELGHARLARGPQTQFVCWVGALLGERSRGNGRHKMT